MSVGRNTSFLFERMLYFGLSVGTLYFGLYLEMVCFCLSVRTHIV